MIITIGVLLISGMAGGYGNHILSKRKVSTANRSKGKWTKDDTFHSVIIGVIASFMVPLFLNTISSTIIKDSIKDNYQYLILAGFCLIASTSSTAFIKQLSERVIFQDGKSDGITKRGVIGYINSARAKWTMQELNEIRTDHFNNDTQNLSNKILDAVLNSGNENLTASDIAIKIKSNTETVTKILDYLVKLKCLYSLNDNDNNIYIVTSKGEQLYEVI